MKGVSMKTVSLELAKQLKENGYPQMSDFSWTRDAELQNQTEYKLLVINPAHKAHWVEYIASPSADEILEKLPQDMEILR